MRILTAAGSALALVVLLSPAAGAQPLVQRSFSTQTFEPAMGTDSLLSVELADVARHLGFGLEMMLNYQHNPLVLQTQRLDSPGGAPIPGSEDELVVVGNQMTSDLVAVVGLHHGWLRSQLGLTVPLDLYVGGNEVNAEGRQGDALSGTLLGDLRLQVKVNLLPRWRGLSLALSPIVTLPTGCLAADSCADDGKFGGSSGVTFRPRLVVDYAVGPVVLAANIGYLLREPATVLSTRIDDQLLYGAGVGVAPHKRFKVMAEIFGRAGFTSQSGCRSFDQTIVCEDTEGSDLDRFPLEAAIGGRLGVGAGLQVTAGAGFGLIRAVGTPQVRVIAGLRWAPDFTDTDGDGIHDNHDRCPTQPEDRDGFRDADGCPDLDNDEDLVPDARDKCPLSAEDRDTFEDADGCPDPDNDKDGVKDLSDHCPFEPETLNGFKDDDGCPDLPDADGDGIADGQDKCPKERETVNGVEDEDGCPDEGDVEIEAQRIVVNKRLRFAGRRIARRSRETLRQLAAALEASPEIREVGIVARPRGKSTRQRRRWQRRGSAVAAFLIAQGVDSSRLRATVGAPAGRRAGIELKITKRESRRQAR